MVDERKLLKVKCLILYSDGRLFFLHLFLADIFLLLLVACLRSIFIIFPVLQNEGLLKVLIFIFCAFVKYSRVENLIVLSVGFSQGFIFTFFEV